MPLTPEEALAAADAIANDEPSEWGRSKTWPADIVKDGIWSPCQWYNGGLAEQAKPLAVWWNSTPARLLLLNQRTKLLDYPNWSLNQLQQIPIPKPDNPAWSALGEAFRETGTMELLPLRGAERCRARRKLVGPFHPLDCVRLAR